MQPSNIRTITASTASLTLTTQITARQATNIAQTYLREGKTAEAVSSLDNAINILTSDPTYDQNHNIEAPLASERLASASSSTSVERAEQAIKNAQYHLEKNEISSAKRLLDEAKKILTDGLSCDEKREQTAHEEEGETVVQMLMGDRQTAIKGSGNTIERAPYATETNVGAAESKKRSAELSTDAIHLEAMRFLAKRASNKGNATLQLVTGDNNVSVHGNTNTITASQTVTSAATSSSANPGDAKLESNEFSPRKAGNMEE